jgi:hypothetical protein
MRSFCFGKEKHMATYSQATINAMNARGRALLDPKKAKPPTPTPAKPVYTIPSGSANVTGQLNGLPYTYTPPKTTSAGNQTSSGSSGGGSSRASDTRTIGSAATAIDTSQAPSYLGNGTSDTGYGGGTSNTAATDTAANDYYADLLAQQEEAARIRTQAALEANNAYIPEINAYNDKRLQDAYISKELNRVNLPQQLSADGYSGGATETSMLGAMTDYENRRGTIEQDRGDAIDKIRKNALQIEATGNADLADAASNYYQNMIAKAQRDQTTYKNDFTNTIGAYADDYMAKINELRLNGYSDDSFEIKALMAARNKKISDQQASQKDADQLAFENYLKQTQLLYNVNKPYFKPTSGGALSYSEALKMYNAGSREQAVLDALGLL